jgi:uncharacterized membrane protein
MECPKCQKKNLNWADYCRWCGIRLVAGPGASGRQLPEADGLPEIKRHLNEMEVRLSKVEGRVTLVSERMGLDPLESHPAVSAGEVLSQPESWGESAVESIRNGVVAREALPSPSVCEPTLGIPEALPRLPAIERSTVEEARTSEPHAEVGAEAIPSVPARPPQKPPESPQPSEMARRMRDWEQSLPGNWLSRIGMLALFIGLGFLTKWAYDRGSLERLPLLLVGLACGGVLLFAGHLWRKTYGAWAQALTGGGIGVLYLSIFASYALYDDPVMPFFATFGLMFLVTILSVGIALRRESMAIAIIGIAGAFLVPMILGASDLYKEGPRDSETNPGLMIAYILVLDAGIVGLSTFRRWRWFTLLGFAGSLAVYGLWYATSGHDGPVSGAEWSLTGIFLCFAAATTLFHVVWRRTPELTDLALMSINAAIYFCVSYGLLWGDYGSWLGLFGVALSGLYAITGYLAWRRSEDNRRLSLFAFGIAIVFLTIAIPVQLHRSYASWITAAWAVEGAALIWIAVRQNMPKWQLWGLGALAMALMGLFAFNGAIDEERFRPFMNDTFWAFTISILAFYSAAYFLRRDGDTLQPWFFPAMMLIANALTVWLFSAEIVCYAGSKMIEARHGGSSFLQLRNIENARSLGLVSLWMAYGFCLLVAGTRKNWDWLRVAGYGLMAVACGMTMALLNHSHAMVRSSESLPIVNYGFAGFAICTLALYLFAHVIAENGEKLQAFDRLVCLVALAAASVLTVWALSAEIVTFVNESENLRNLLLVILWTAYGCVLMAVVVWRNGLLPRLGASGLMVMGVGATVALLNHWHAGIQEGVSTPIVNYSFGGFAVCVAALYLFAYLTSRDWDKFGSFRKPTCALALAVANVLTLWAFSAEVTTFLVESENLRSLMLVVLWSGYGLLLMLVGVWRSVPAARFCGYALIGIAAGMALTILNHSQTGLERTNSNWIANYSFGGLFVCICAIYVAAYLLANHRSKLLNAERMVLPVLISAANALTLFALSSEVLTYVESGYGKSMGLTLLWAAYGLALVVVGIMGKSRWVRLGGLALVSVAILKLFIWDTFHLQSGYRVAAYLILGVLLLAGGYFYHRYANVIKGFIMDRPGKGSGSAQS